jgi:hypothetical protein
MGKAVFLALSMLAFDTHADVFKCVEKYGAIRYQANPCSGNTEERKLDIVTDPAAEAAARAKLERIQDEYDTRKADKEKKDKELAEEQRAAAALEFARRSAIAQQEQALAQQRQAAALEKQNRFNSRPYYIFPPTRPIIQPVRPNALPAPRLPAMRSDNPLLND